jgi:hypothetical protein
MKESARASNMSDESHEILLLKSTGIQSDLTAIIQQFPIDIEIMGIRYNPVGIVESEWLICLYFIVLVLFSPKV